MKNVLRKILSVKILIAFIACFLFNPHQIYCEGNGSFRQYHNEYLNRKIKCENRLKRKLYQQQQSTKNKQECKQALLIKKILEKFHQNCPKSMKLKEQKEIEHIVKNNPEVFLVMFSRLVKIFKNIPSTIKTGNYLLFPSKKLYDLVIAENTIWGDCDVKMYCKQIGSDCERNGFMFDKNGNCVDSWPLSTVYNRQCEYVSFPYDTCDVITNFWPTNCKNHQGTMIADFLYNEYKNNSILSNIDNMYWTVFWATFAVAGIFATGTIMWHGGKCLVLRYIKEKKKVKTKKKTVSYYSPKKKTKKKKVSEDESSSSESELESYDSSSDSV